jgi:cytochrome c peroxidase
MKRGRLLAFVLCVALGAASCRKDEPNEEGGGLGPFSPTPYPLELPTTLPPMEVPEDNPLTVQGVELGRYLFYEERLSGNNTQSCSSCHGAAFNFTDQGNAFSIGIDGIAGTRNSMPLMNLGYDQFFFWDGRAATLEDQILKPVVDPVEMHDTWPAVVAELQDDPAYSRLFFAAFGDSRVDSLKAAKAIAQFLRTMVSGNSKYDRVRRFEEAFTPDEAEGYNLFNKEGGPEGQPIELPDGTILFGQGGADCFHCHTDAAGLFTDGQFHNNGLDSEFNDPGRGGITGIATDMGRFKTPSLRNAELSAPYMHDGRFQTLEQVIDHYEQGGHPSLSIDPFMKFTDPDLTLELGPVKKAQLMAFLKTLTDVDFVNDARFSDPGEPQ